MEVGRTLRSGAVLATLLAAGAGAGVAFADVLPVPPVPTPTLPLPLPPVPTPPLPKLPALPTAPAPAPKAPAQLWTPPIAGIASARSLTLGPSASGSGSGSSSGSARRSRGAKMTRLRSSRPWIAAQGPVGHRRTTLTFRLRAAAVVVFTVKEVSPTCRVVGTFTVRGHAGLNKVVFRGRVRGRTLPSGTYRISAHRRGGGALLRVTVVIVESGVPTPTELESAKRSNVCGARAALASSGISAGSSGTAAPEQPRRNGPQGTQHGGSAPKASGVAGTSRTHASPFTPAEISKHVTNPLVIAALAAAILLLGLAALPKEAIPDPRLTDVLARHRIEVAFAGSAALAAAIVALAFA